MSKHTQAIELNKPILVDSFTQTLDLPLPSLEHPNANINSFTPSDEKKTKDIKKPKKDLTSNDTNNKLNNSNNHSTSENISSNVTSKLDTLDETKSTIIQNVNQLSTSTSTSSPSPLPTTTTTTIANDHEIYSSKNSTSENLSSHFVPDSLACDRCLAYETEIMVLSLKIQLKYSHNYYYFHFSIEEFKSYLG